MDALSALLWESSGWIISVFTLLGVLTAVRAIMWTRTSQGAIGWATSLILFPYLAVPMYWIFGRSRFEGYVRAHRAKRADLKSVAESVRASMEAESSGTPGSNAASEAAFTFERLSPHLFTPGNELDLLINGEETFDAIFESISLAQTYVLIEFFVLRDDELGHRLADVLVERARAGVACYVLYDEVGSRKLGEPYVRKLSDAGIHIAPFSTTRGVRRLLLVNFRNHRKIVVVDGRAAFVGGFNVGDEYMGADPDNSPWRDTHLRMQGPVVLTVQLAFMEDWHWARPDDVLELNWAPKKIRDPGMTALAIPSGPADEFETCGLMFLEAIRLAKERIWIATPYLVPDPPAVTALQLAALRGVDVRIVMPDSSDSILADSAGFTFYRELLPYGVKLFRYERGFMHQKVMLVDENLAAVGSANFDNRSFRLNFEITALCTDASFVSDVREMLTEDFEKSRRVDADEHLEWSFLFRFRCRLSRLSASIQ